MDSVDAFFAAWGETDAAERARMIKGAMAPSGSYADPRTPDAITDIDALCDYVGQFSQNAPGWTARVVQSDTVQGLTRATIAFGGPGPDGNDMLQHGQYFIELEAGKITRMTGFAGTGAPA